MLVPYEIESSYVMKPTVNGKAQSPDPISTATDSALAIFRLQSRVQLVITPPAHGMDLIWGVTRATAPILPYSGSYTDRPPPKLRELLPKVARARPSGVLKWGERQS